jgi:hypothetical protein
MYGATLHTKWNAVVDRDSVNERDHLHQSKYNFIWPGPIRRGHPFDPVSRGCVSPWEPPEVHEILGYVSSIGIAVVSGT